MMYQWDRYFSPAAEVKLRSTVVDIRRKKEHYHVVLDGPTVYDRDFDAVVVAVGFGTERTIEGALNYSYWTDFDPSMLVDDSSPKLIVSGTGDGGCIDAIRAALPAFDQGYLAITLARLLDKNPALVKTITEIEQAAEGAADAEEAGKIISKHYAKL